MFRVLVCEACPANVPRFFSNHLILEIRMAEDWPVGSTQPASNSSIHWKFMPLSQQNSISAVDCVPLYVEQPVVSAMNKKARIVLYMLFTRLPVWFMEGDFTGDL